MMMNNGHTSVGSPIERLPTSTCKFYTHICNVELLEVIVQQTTKCTNRYNNANIHNSNWNFNLKYILPGA